MDTKRAALFLNGTWAEPDRLPLRPGRGDLIACADGGADYALKLGLAPDLLIGDMDSVSEFALNSCREKGTELMCFPADKDKSDMELALEQLWQRGLTRIALYGALGGRIDHELTNLSVAAHFAGQGPQITLVDDDCLGYLLHGPAKLELEGQPGETLSLVPLSTQVQGVNLSGVKWPLSAATLYFGSSRAISNQFAMSRVQIDLSCGDLLATHFPKKHF